MTNYTYKAKRRPVSSNPSKGTLKNRRIFENNIHSETQDEKVKRITKLVTHSSTQYPFMAISGKTQNIKMDYYTQMKHY
jgi:hypothetical protein